MKTTWPSVGGDIGKCLKLNIVNHRKSGDRHLLCVMGWGGTGRVGRALRILLKIW